MRSPFSSLVNLATIVWTSLVTIGPSVSAPAQSLRVDGFAPARGSTGESIRIDGVGFSNAYSVTFNGVPAPFSATADTQIIATVPSQATTGQIVVRAGGSIAISADPFRVFAPGPRPLAFTPAAAPVGTIIEIQGERFTNATVAFFPPNNIRALTSVPAENRLQTVVPEGAESGPIVVASPEGFNATEWAFRVTDRVDLAVRAPTAPTEAPVGALTTLTVELEEKTGSGVENARLFLTLPNASLQFSGSPSPAVLAIQPTGSLIELTLAPLNANTPIDVDLEFLATEAFEPSMFIVEIVSDETEVFPEDNAIGVTWSAPLTAPFLQVTRLSPDRARLRWPRYPESTRLQRTLSAAEPQWEDVDAPYSEDATARWIDIQATQARAFFRLIR